jgi:5-methylcytosine-specific restriction endonuclease McrA
MAKWRGPQKPSDPLLTATSHKRNKAHWRRLRLPCQLCGRQIDYTGPRYLNGKQNPASLVVGHVVSRYHAKRMGWSEAEINSLANSRPECQACSNRMGASLGATVKNGRHGGVRFSRTDADRW